MKKLKNKKIKNEFAGKVILLINAGSIKKRFIIQKLKKMDLTLVVLGPEVTWAKPYVDYWVPANNNNHSQAIDSLEYFLASNPAIRLDGALTFWEDDVLLASKIIDKYNLVGIPYKISKKIRNKNNFRAFCIENNIPAPANVLIRSQADVSRALRKLKFPVVLKPVFGSSSAFVVKADDKEQFREVYQYIKKNISAQTESALHEGIEILVEEYIDGNEVDIDIILQNGKIKFFSISDNYKTKEPFFVETNFAIPSDLPEDSQDDLVELAESSLEKLGVQNGCIHFEAKSTKNGPVPIEINLRMGGDEVYSLVKGAWGFDLIENAVRIALGVYIDKYNKPEEPLKYIISENFLSDHSGVLVNLDIDEKLEKKSFVEEINFFKKIGDPILVPPEGYEYFGWLTVSGDNSVQAEENLEEALKHIKYDIVRFGPTSSVGKTTRRNYLSMAAMNKNIVKAAAKIEKIRRMSIKNQRKLHIGIACNLFEGGDIESELSSVGKNIEKALSERGYRVTFFDFNNLPKAFSELKDRNVDMVFNVCERINNSSLLEPHAAAILDALQIPYTGSNPFTLGLCIDKIRVKKLLNYHGIPTPKWDYAYKLQDSVNDDLKYPLIVKPSNTDNSIGITNDSVVVNEKQLRKQIEKVIVGLKSPALIEEYIEGDEYDVPIIGSEEDDLRVLPLSRSIFDKLPEGYWHIYPYDAKWSDGGVYKKNITVEEPSKSGNKKLESLITEIALDTYNILDCHDYGRVEIKVDSNDNPYVLELNPNPSINVNNCLPRVARFVNMDYGDFLEEVIRMAIKRYKNKPPYYHLMASPI